jgi:hypothetical protein
MNYKNRLKAVDAAKQKKRRKKISRLAIKLFSKSF